MKLSFALFVAALGVSSLALSGLASAQRRARKVKLPYARVADLIRAECANCHNNARHPEGINLSTYKSLMAGAEHGPIVVPGHPEKSALILYVDGSKKPRMPFRQAPMKQADISLLRAWVATGASR